MSSGKWIEESLYKKIKQLMPLPCVDLLILHKGRLLLMLRKNEPGEGEWFVPGGRILHGETIEEAVLRNLKDETGLTPVKIERIDVMEHIWAHTHTVTVFHRIIVSTSNVVMNDEHSEYKWVKEIPEKTHSFLLHMIKEAKIFKEKNLRK